MAFKSIDATTDVDPQPIADAVVDALGPDLVDAATVEASCETAIADKVADNSIPAKTTVTDVPGQVITELNTGSSTLSRAVASALQALVDAVAANTIPSDADVAAVPASTVTALNTGTSTVSRVTASVQLGIANKVSDGTIPSDADVAAVPANTATALNTGNSTLSRVVASADASIAAAALATAAGLTAAVSPLATAAGLQPACEAAIDAKARGPILSASGFAGPGTLQDALVGAPGAGLAYEIVGWHVYSYTAINSPKIAWDSSDFTIGTNMPVGATSTVLSGERLFVTTENEGLVLDKSNDATCAMTIYYRIVAA